MTIKPLHEWSGRRVVAIALVWVVGLPLLVAPAVFGAVGWLARTERERGAARVADSLAPGLRVDYAPQVSDFSMSVVGTEIMLLVGMFLLPPIALCLAWIILRRRRVTQSA
jgi:hypothetical protein